jgi:hypothetical protein
MTYNYALQATDSGTISFIKRTGVEGLQYYNFTGIPSLTNKWTYITATILNNTLQLYINGVLFGSQPVGIIGPGTYDLLSIGGMIG